MRYIKLRLTRFVLKLIQSNDNQLYTNDNPFGIVMGNDTFMKKPKEVNGGHYISIENNTSIGHSAWLGAYDNYLSQNFTPHINIGKNVHIGNYACITAIDEIQIEDGCLFSEYVYISDHYHGIDPSLEIEPAKQPLFSKGKVFIGKNTFIGYRVTILSGVSLGRNCIVGAHSVVNKSFPDYSMIAGIPAKLIKKYSFENRCWVDVNKKDKEINR